MVPLSTSWVISPRTGTIAKLMPNYEKKRFDIEVITGMPETEVNAATLGTVQDGNMVYSLDGKIYRTPIKTISR